MRLSVFSVLVLGAFLIILPRLAVASENDPIVVLPSATHDFGEVMQGATVEHIFELHNNSAEAISIQGADIEVPGLILQVPPSIPPGQVTKLRMELDTNHFKGKIDDEITVFLDHPEMPQLVLTAKGFIRGAIDVMPHPVLFWGLFDGETKLETLTIVNNQDKPVEITGLESSSEYVTASIETVRSGYEYRLPVSLRGSPPFGLYREQIKLTTDDPDHPKLQVVVNLKIKKDVYAAPRGISYGQIALDEMRANPKLAAQLPKTFLVIRRQGKMRVLSVQTDVPFVEISQDPLAPSERFRFDVSLIADRLERGSMNGNIRILTDDPAFPEIVVLVRGKIE